MNTNKTLKITLPALAFLLLSVGTAYAASDQGFQRFTNLSDTQRDVLEESRELRQDGDWEAARELVENAGIDIPRFRRGPASEEMMEKHEAVRLAIENDDYDSFLELTEDSPMQVEISEDDFNKIVEAHALRVAGDYDGARKIMEDSSLNIGVGRMLGRGGMGRGMGR